MRYLGIAVGGAYHHLCALEEMRAPEPPIRLGATFYEPGSVDEVAAQVHALGEVVVAIGAPIGGPLPGRDARLCDEELRKRGVATAPSFEPGQRLRAALADLPLYVPDSEGRAGRVSEGAFRAAPAFETNVEGVFCALQGRRLPAKRHPLGVQRRIQELLEDQVLDEGGDLWHRRIDEIDAAAAALAAHRYAVGHACWVGEPAEGVVVLPGYELPDRFTSEGVLPPVARVPLAS